MQELREFIAKMELVDVPTISNTFTWFSGDCKYMSRLERFLIYESLRESWIVVGQHI